MKKILIAFAIASMSFMSQAAYLYWQVQSDDYTSSITEPSKVDTAYLYAKKEGAADQKIGALKIGNSQEYYAIDVSNYGSEYSFYVELVNYNSGAKDVLGYSESVAYTTMKNSGFILENPLSITSANVWHGSSYAAPEPTSAMMILLGLAGLALKRKRV